MIKMYIDNEEVVCNKEFTIKEEMLSTSSTILNNCYPKSWEQDHDYISRFYYPKDYSKCLIYQDVTIPKSQNLFDPNNANLLAAYTGSTLVSSANSKTLYIECKPNTKYTIFRGLVGKRFQAAECSQLPAIGVSLSNNTPDSFNNEDSTINFTTSNTAKYLCVFYSNIGGNNLINNNGHTELELRNTIVITEDEKEEEQLIFAGMVKNSGNISLNPRYPKYCNLEILDFKDFLSTGETLDFVINEKTIAEAISMVIDTVSQYGFVLGNINILNSDEVIGAYSTENKSAYDVLQYLADISQSRWTTRMIDENTVAIDFYDPTLMPSGIDIEYTNEWWCNNKVVDLYFNYGTRDYRNKQVMLSDEVYGGVDYDETILANGYDKTFLTTTKIGIVNAIYVEGVVKTFATNEEKELGIEADFYYTPGENTFSCNENDSYSAGTQIVINYTPLVRGREVILNSDEISRINTNTGRKGIVARYETRNDVLSSNELKMVGETYIKYKGVAEIIVTLQTKQDLYNVGESVYFDAPIDELSTDYMVKNKSTEIIATTGDVFYTYELTNSFNSESAINWFDNQRNKTTGNITMGQSINRNIDVEATANIIWDNLTITEVNITTDNVLNSPLNSPFVK